MKHKQKEENVRAAVSLTLEAYVPCFPKTDKDSKESYKD